MNKSKGKRQQEIDAILFVSDDRDLEREDDGWLKKRMEIELLLARKSPHP